MQRWLRDSTADVLFDLSDLIFQDVDKVEGLGEVLPGMSGLSLRFQAKVESSIADSMERAAYCLRTRERLEESLMVHGVDEDFAKKLRGRF